MSGVETPRGGAIERGLATREELAGAGELSLSPGRLQHIMQLALQAQPVRPVPEVVEVELQMGVLDDAKRILEIMRTTGLEFQNNEVLRAAHPRGQAEEVQGLSPSQRLCFVRVRRKDQVEWNARMGRMAQTKDPILGHRVLHDPPRVELEPARKKGVSQFGPDSFLGQDKEIDVLSGPEATPGVHSQGSDQTIGWCGLGEGVEHGPQVTGQWILVIGRHRLCPSLTIEVQRDESGGTGSRMEEKAGAADAPRPERRPGTISTWHPTNGNTRECLPPV